MLSNTYTILHFPHYQIFCQKKAAMIHKVTLIFPDRWRRQRILNYMVLYTLHFNIIIWQEKCGNELLSSIKCGELPD
jgi:hypothetical protein